MNHSRVLILVFIIFCGVLTPILRHGSECTQTEDSVLPLLKDTLVSSNSALILTGKYSHQEIDSDNDSLINWLIFYVEFNVTVADMYYILFGIIPTEFESSRSSKITVNWTPGLYNISATYDAGEMAYSKQLVSSYYTGYILWGTVPSQYSQTIYPDYITRIYNYTEFDPPSAFFTGNYFDEGVDTSGDGLFDFLAFICEVNITVPGTYSIFLGMEEAQDRYLDAGDLPIYTNSLLSGIYNITFLFPCIELYVNQWSTYFLYSWAGIIDIITQSSLGEAYSVYTTRIYNYTEYGPWAEIIGSVSDIGKDTDNDSYFNEVEIKFRVNISVAEEYEFWLSCYSLIGSYSWDLTTKQTLSKGIHSISVSIPIEQSDLAYPQHINTSFIITSISIEKPNQRKNTLVDKLVGPFATQTYTYNEFDDPYDTLSSTTYSTVVNFSSSLTHPTIHENKTTETTNSIANLQSPGMTLVSLLLALIVFIGYRKFE